MKREIKFKAYDKRFNVMLSNIIPCSPSILLTDVNFNLSYGDKSDERNEIGVDDGGPEHYCITDDQIEVMQWVGYRDYYEGAILQNPKGDIGVIVWHQSGFYLKAKRKNETDLHIPLTEGFMCNKRCIGNIYENPELISLP